ncbi:hypothetical protein M758_11G142300 [Ceratodon purpureus]|nr:hypothetical protein M758_11G142300 [Ceratodon purpureus]
MVCMGGELRLKARARERRAMARPSDMMKNKRKEVEDDEDDDGRPGGCEKRSKLNVEEGEHHHNHVEVFLREDVEHGEVERILEARRRRGTRPLPVMVGERAVDLMGLHLKVEGMGGYGRVTEGRMWGGIAEGLGLGMECGPGLKLVFVKYLKGLERQVSVRVDASQPSSSELRWEGRHHENGELWHREGSRFRRKGDESGSDEAGGTLSDDETIGDLRDRQHRGRQQLECRQSSTSEDWATTYASGGHLDGDRNPNDRGAEARGSDEDPGVSEDWYEGCREENVNQQREALNGMMEWIKRVALSPGDSSIGMGMPGSGQDEDWVSQCQMLTARVRSALWREPRGGDGSMQVKPMPSAYYDESARPDAQALERLRATRERLAQLGFQPSPGPKSYHHDRNAEGSYWGTAGGYAGHRSGRQTVNHNEASLARYNQQRKRIPIGQDFQADEVRWVPRDHLHRSGYMTQEESAGEGPSCSSDEEDGDETRWLGVPVWPQPEQQVGNVVDSSLLIRVGRGRAPSCECSEPGSIDCVRVHIDEARERLHQELGQAWVEMGFDQMGECVADQWTKEEERTFRLVARTHPVSKNSNFWNHLPDALPFKSRKELNSYYFNVFMLRRRALQNRLRESKIDSDDDEGELPGESDDSEYDSTDDEDEDDDGVDDDDAGSEDMQPGVILYPVQIKTPMDSTRVPKYRPLPDFNYIPSEPEVARIDRAQIIAEDLPSNHMADHADDSHVVCVWDDKHLETSGSLVRDGVLSQEWQEPHWDDREHQQGVVTSTRQLSPPIHIGKDATADVRQAPGLGDLWSQGMEMAPKQEKDRLLSTNGMILELFGDDVSD